MSCVVRFLAPLVALTALAGCTPAAAPVVLPTVTEAAPTAAATPDETARLQAEAKQAYLTAMEEWHRLRLAGGAEEPSDALREVADGEFLGNVSALLRNQREQGIRVEGEVHRRVINSPGDSLSGSDPQLTLVACEDGSRLKTVHEGSTKPGRIAQNKVFGKVINGKVKIIDSEGEFVEQCDF